MIPLLGMTCVAWTAYEILRLVQAAARPTHAEGIAGGEASRPSPRPRRVRFAAWDEQGRPIDVEDLGQA